MNPKLMPGYVPEEKKEKMPPRIELLSWLQGYYFAHSGVSNRDFLNDMTHEDLYTRYLAARASK